MDKPVRCDVAVIGAGIAGASIAAQLSTHCRVILIESEAQPGYHTTGRSAALFLETYGPPPVRALTRASAKVFNNPPNGFAGNPLLTPRGFVMLAQDNQRNQLEALIAEIPQHDKITRLNADELHKIAPILKRNYAVSGVYDQTAMDIDVHALHHGYLRQFKENSGTLKVNAQVEGISKGGSGWILGTRAGEIHADLIVNAAGAWADELGSLAGARSIGLVPKRRTALIVATPDANATDKMPLVADIDEQFYLKPETGRLLISPSDETPSPACDAQPEELDIAVCIDRIEKAFDFKVGRIENKWAGLRSFVPDKSPVVGFDNAQSGFFLAGRPGRVRHSVGPGSFTIGLRSGA